MTDNTDDFNKAANDISTLILQKHRVPLLRDLRKKLAVLDPSDESTFLLALNTIQKFGVTVPEVAEILKTSRAQVSRWTENRSVPRHPDFRVWIVGALLDFMADPKDASPPSSPPQTPPPEGGAKLLKFEKL